MLRNYLKILIRNFIRNKTFSIINILGLSVGLTCVLLIGLYVVDEYSFDRYHEKLDRIYMVITEATFDGHTNRWTGVANKAATTIAKEIPEVEKAVRLFPHKFGNLAFISTDTVKSSEKMVMWADPEIFDVLSFIFLKGDPTTALVRPNTAVVSFEELHGPGPTVTVTVTDAFGVTSNQILRHRPAEVIGRLARCEGQPEPLREGRSHHETAEAAADRPWR